MQKIFILLAAISTLALFLIGHTLTPALATEPTPTVIPAPCHLSLTVNCDLTHPSPSASEGLPRTFPTAGERGVPPHALISIAFATAMDPTTLNRDAFFVTQGNQRLEGKIEYIQASHMVVFQPAALLQPNTTYTATVTTAIKDAAGQPLPAEISWSFTTAAGQSPFGPNGLTLAGVAASQSMKVYIGDLHAHTGHSGGQGTPTEAFASARASGRDFFAVTEHDYLMSEAEWQDVLVQAQAHSIEGVFIGLRGFEFHHPEGHLNVFKTNTYVQATDPTYDTLAEFYAWLIAQPEAIGQFNHPLPNFNFNNFAYNSTLDHKITLRELSTPEQFYLSLNAGWHVGTLLNSDTHLKDWGCCPRMGLLAPALTETDILQAMRAKRTFYVPPADRNFAVAMQANGYWMGSAIPITPTINFIINTHNPDGNGGPLHLNLYDNGTPVLQITLANTALTTWTPSLAATLGHYYFVEALEDGWALPAYSSPIWVERSPLAEAGLNQIVPPGARVTLEGGGSSDPDNKALAYHWRQTSGPTLTLSQADMFQPTATFTAPATLGEFAFGLTVVDPGDLTATDSVSVTVTDKALLAISKSGPVSALPDEPITYTLTVTNFGVVTTTGLVITDAVPQGATYLSGGTLLPGNIVSWTVSGLAPYGGFTQTLFVVTTTQAIVNDKYGAFCANCIPAVGTVPIYTNQRRIYLPLITKF